MILFSELAGRDGSTILLMGIFAGLVIAAIYSIKQRLGSRSEKDPP
jgi:hypothetical protein